MIFFPGTAQSHAHSLKTLEALYGYDDFMESISTMVDLGCGPGLDLEWWATRTTRDELAEPLNIKCMGVDISRENRLVNNNPNITYQTVDFEQTINPLRQNLFDLLWCHDAFQYAKNPVGTLLKWREIANPDAMLVLILPQTTNLVQNRSDIAIMSGCFYHYTLVNVIYMLAATGWDCNAGFFQKNIHDPWIHAIVYKHPDKPTDPYNVTWYELAEKKLIPDSAIASVNRRGYLRQQDLVLPWLDKNLTSFAKH